MSSSAASRRLAPQFLPLRTSGSGYPPCSRDHELHAPIIRSKTGSANEQVPPCCSRAWVQSRQRVGHGRPTWRHGFSEARLCRDDRSLLEGRSRNFRHGADSNTNASPPIPPLSGLEAEDFASNSVQVCPPPRPRAMALVLCATCQLPAIIRLGSSGGRAWLSALWTAFNPATVLEAVAHIQLSCSAPVLPLRATVRNPLICRRNFCI